MIKPCTGYSCEIGEKLFYEAALGGCDVVKDGELIADMAFNRCEDRVEALFGAPSALINRFDPEIPRPCCRGRQPVLS